jgi:hypothetical protein
VRRQEAELTPVRQNNVPTHTKTAGCAVIQLTISISRYAVRRQGMTTLWRSWTMNEENRGRSLGPPSLVFCFRSLETNGSAFSDITPRSATTMGSHLDFVIHARLRHVLYTDKMHRMCQGFQRNADNSLRNPQSIGYSLQL